MTTKYQIVSGSDESQVALEVSNLLSQGWILSGGVSVAAYYMPDADWDKVGVFYSQAQIKTPQLVFELVEDSPIGPYAVSKIVDP